MHEDGRLRDTTNGERCSFPEQSWITNSSVPVNYIIRIANEMSPVTEPKSKKEIRKDNVIGWGHLPAHSSPASTSYFLQILYDTTWSFVAFRIWSILLLLHINSSAFSLFPGFEQRQANCHLASLISMLQKGK